MTQDIKYNNISYVNIKQDNIDKEILDINIVREICNVRNPNKEKWIKSEIKEYFLFLIKLIVKQCDLEKKAKMGCNDIKYPIYINKENYDNNLISKNVNFMQPAHIIQLEAFEKISPIYKKINWLSGPVGLPIYDKYYIYKIFPRLYKYNKQLYSKKYKHNINEIIMHYSKYNLYLECLKELIDQDYKNTYQGFNIELSTSSFSIPYFLDQGDMTGRVGFSKFDCQIYYLHIKW